MTVEDVVRTHTEGFNRALTTHDLDALSAIYADDYMLVRPDGSVLGKEDVLRDLGAGGLRFTSIDLANVSVRIYDQTALLTGDSRTVTSRNGDEMSAHTLVVNGHHDVMIPTLNSYTLSQHIPRAQLIIYPDSGHGVLFQFPELFVAHGRMFLEGS